VQLRRRFVLLFSSLAVWGFARAVQAAEPGRRAREYRVDFQAKRVQVEGELGSLELDGEVRVQAQRYRLKSQHLQLQRGPRGVEIDGSADVAFCTCDDPPVNLRVAHATLAPPTDALFENARLEVWGVPMLWLPRLWLRAPTRPGLTLPRLSYRGEDGVFAGGGAYFPLSVVEGRVATSLTVGAGAYSARGARLEAELDTEASSNRVGWDHVRQTALEIDAHGSAALSEATFAYRIDALRGARAARAPSSLEVAARRTDRARASVSRVDEFALGFAVHADAARGAALRDFGAVGPELSLGDARSLGPNVAYDVLTRARTTTRAESHSQSGLFERGTLRAHLRPGPLGVALTFAHSGELEISEYGSRGLLRAGLSAKIGLPLLRNFGSLAHFVEPVLVARSLVEAAPRGAQLNGARRSLAAGGIDTSLGQRATRQGFRLTLRAGALERSTSSASFVAMTRTSADAHWVGGSQSFAMLGGGGGLVSLSRVRLGPPDSLHLLLRADGGLRGSPAGARVLFDEGWFDPARPFLDRNGWSGGSELSIPWTAALTSSAAIDYDLTERVLLAAWGGLSFRHSCGCLAVGSYLGHRVGRGGLDAWLGFDLAP